MLRKPHTQASGKALSLGFGGVLSLVSQGTNSIGQSRRGSGVVFSKTVSDKRRKYEELQDSQLVIFFPLNSSDLRVTNLYNLQHPHDRRAKADIDWACHINMQC